MTVSGKLILPITVAVALLGAWTCSAAEESNGIWLGAAPICRSQPSSCDAFDLRFARADQNGGGGACWAGQKVLCQFQPLAKQLSSTEATKLTLVSYNIFARPYIVAHDGQRERTCRIPRALLSEVPTLDVIVFQEAFLPGCLANSKRLSLRGVLQNYGFAYTTRTVGTRRWGLRINGGVFIASRWPIERQAQMVYRHSHPGSADSLANKGVVYARINKQGTVYNVFGTHFQAEAGAEFERYRELQAAEMRQFMQSQSLDPNEPVLIAGDFNADMLASREHLKRVLDNLNASLPRIQGRLRATYDPTQNDVVEAGATNQMWLDYVAYCRDHKAPASATLRALRLLADRPLSMCVSAPLLPTYVAPGSTGCSRSANTRHLSDHFPVVAEFRFR